MCCSPWGLKGSDTTEQLKWTELTHQEGTLSWWSGCEVLCPPPPVTSSATTISRHTGLGETRQRSKSVSTHSQTPTSFLSSHGSPVAFTWCNSLCLVPFFCPSFLPSCGYYAKWNKPNRERQILPNFTYRLNLKKPKKQAKQNGHRLIDTENKWWLLRREWGGEVGKLGERGFVETS